MNQEISYTEFCRKIKDNEIIWGINNLWLSIFYVSNFLATVLYFSIFLLLLLSALPIIYFANIESYWFLIFLIPVLIGSLAGNPNLNFIDIIFCLFIFIISAVLSAIFGYGFYKVGWLPVICFIISSIIKGVVINGVEREIVDNAVIFQLLKSKNQLVIFENYAKNKNF